MKQAVITATPQQVEDAFAEWIRRYRAQPEQFIRPDETLMTGTPEMTSKLAAPYFMQLLNEIQDPATALCNKPKATAKKKDDSLFITVPKIRLPSGVVVPKFRIAQYFAEP